VQENQLIENVWDVSVKVEENGYYWPNKPFCTSAKDLDESKPFVIELFCGCGGTSLGFEMAGYEIALGADIHSPSISTFRKKHPRSASVLGNVKLMEPEMIKELIEFPKVDVLIAGVPCQGFSLNNRKRHSDDDRNFLYLEFVRMVRELKPKVVVLENVSGMKSTANGSFVEAIEKDLSEAGDMNVTSGMLCAADYGVPQKRNRLFFIGIEGHDFDFDEVERTHGEGTSNPYVTIKEAIGDLPSLQSGEFSYKYKCEPFAEYQKFMRTNAPENLMNHKAPRHPHETTLKIAQTKPGEPMYPRFKQRIRLAWDIQSPTQVSGGIRPQFQFGHPEDDRGLTVRERCRIQSFPDNFEVVGGTVQGRVQTGNAVPPLLAKAVAMAIKKHL
jgi:DNA (cytosine-5)-methyltransferase 1